LKQLSLCISFLICFVSHAIAQDAPTDAFSVISRLSNGLYKTGELTGGSKAEWQSLEELAVSDIDSALQDLEANSSVRNEQGRTPLHEASAEGFHLLVEAILSNEIGKTWINSEDKNGLTAFEHAQLAIPQTMMACHPEVENPFVLVPYLVKLPYYHYRDPFPKVHTMLVQAGANTSTRSAKEFWLKACSQSDPEVRAMVEGSEDLYATFTEVSLAVEMEKRLREIEEKAQILRELTPLMPTSTRPSPDELKEQIQEMYRNEGFEPPED
jgi:ankyrin repeat protein